MKTVCINVSPECERKRLYKRKRRRKIAAESLLTDDVFEYQIPSDDERDEFAHADVTVNVCRPGFWHSRRELGVAQA